MAAETAYSRNGDRGKKNANKMVDIVSDLESCRDIGQLMGILVSPGRKSPRYKIVF